MAAKTIKRQDVRFAGSTGDELAGILDLPGKQPEAYGLFAHCFTGGKDSAAARRVSRALVERGMAVLRFDFAGVGDSGGDFAESTFSSRIDDIRAAAEYLDSQGSAPSLLVGHSLGGAAVLAAAGQIPSVTAVVTIGAPSDPQHVTHLFAHAVDDIEQGGYAEVLIGGRPVRIGKDFLDDLEEHRQSERIAALGRPLLLLHAPHDEIVGIDNAGVIYAAARHPKSFVALDGADHLLTNVRQARRVAQLIAAWADPYLPESFTPEID